MEGAIIHPSFNNEGVQDIRHSIRMVVGTKKSFSIANSGYGFIFRLLQNATDVITKCDKSLLQNASGFL